MKNNRIAMFCHDDPLAQPGSQEIGGQAVYVNSLIKELDKEGWAVDVFIRLDSPHKKHISIVGKRIRVIRLKGGPARYISRKLLFSFLPELYISFLDFIGHQNPYALFHGHYWDGGWIALQAHRQFNIPFIENFHSLGKLRLQTREKYLGNENQKDVFDKRFSIEDEIIKDADSIISLSESEKVFLQKLYNAPPEKVIVIPGGVNLKVFSHIFNSDARGKLNLDNKDFLLLFAGRLEWRKGIGTILYAANLLKDLIPNLRILIVGGKIYGRQNNVDDHKEYQKLMKIVNKLGLDSIVNFIGCVDHNRMPLFYSAANVFIVPSYYEPFGLVAIESMACGTPVIASEVGGLAAIIKNNVNGLLFEPRNPVSLKEKIMQVYKSKDLTELVIKNGLQDVVNLYSWKNIAKKISGIYDDAIKNNGR